MPCSRMRKQHWPVRQILEQCSLKLRNTSSHEELEGWGADCQFPITSRGNVAANSLISVWGNQSATSGLPICKRVHHSGFIPPCSWYLYWGSCWESVIGAWRMMKCSWLCRGRTHICASWVFHLAGGINGRCNIGSRSSKKCVELGLDNIQEPQGRKSESRVTSQGWRTAGLILDQQVSHGLHTLVWFRVTDC